MSHNTPPQSDTVVEVSEHMATLLSDYAAAVVRCGWEHEREVGDADFHSADAKAKFYALLREIARLEGENKQLRLAGSHLANAAYNLAQMEQPISDRTRQSLKECQESWDAVALSSIPGMSHA